MFADGFKGDEGADGFETDGEVRVMGATIKGRLVLTGAKLRNREGHALNLDGASLRVFELNLSASEVEGSIVVTHTNIDHLQTGKEPPPVVATGWKIGDIHGPVRHGWRAARNWLDSTLDAAMDP